MKKGSTVICRKSKVASRLSISHTAYVISTKNSTSPALSVNMGVEELKYENNKTVHDSYHGLPS